MKYLGVCLLITILVSCNDSKVHELELIIKRWDGKELFFPSEITLFQKRTDTVDRLIETYSFKILSYVDSLGCTSCKLQLPKWKVLIGELDSITNGNVDVLFFMHPKDRKEIEYILRRDHFDYPVCIDEADSLNKLNHFPTDERFQTFLLDKNNKVLAIGNPVHNPKVKALYLKIILGDKAPKQKKEIRTTLKMNHSSVDMGSFDWQQEQRTVFTFTNTGIQPLVIVDVSTSCGCTSAEYPKAPITPGQDAKIEVVYKADRPEHFDKTITVYCNVEDSPIVLKIKGNAQ